MSTQRDPLSRLDNLESHLTENPTPAATENAELVEHVQGEMVTDHDGSVHHVPAAVTREALALLVDDLAEVSPSAFDRKDARKLVVARSLANCVSDSWNPHYKANE